MQLLHRVKLVAAVHGELMVSLDALDRSTSSSMTPTTAWPIKAVRLRSQLGVAIKQHGVRTQNKVTELQEDQTGNY